jgi:curved DNA-binding protein CbpA
MAQISFSLDWVRQLSDPYAVLGLSVSADDRRVTKRYRAVAKLLHPDSYITSEPAARELASQIFARLVSPAYQKLKQDKGRAEHIAVLRFRVRQMSQEEFLTSHNDLARQLLQTPPQSLDILYEQAVAYLAESQYEPLQKFAIATQQLQELNLVYLRLKMGEPLLREKRNGIIPVDDLRDVSSKATSTTIDYAERHYERAVEYAKKSHWSLVVQELRDAIRLEASRSKYHALLAKAYLMQNLTGMATVHFRQALKLNPKEPLALEYAQKLKINLNSNGRGGDQKAGGGLFGLFARKR